MCAKTYSGVDCVPVIHTLLSDQRGMRLVVWIDSSALKRVALSTRNLLGHLKPVPSLLIMPETLSQPHRLKNGDRIVQGERERRDIYSQHRLDRLSSGIFHQGKPMFDHHQKQRAGGQVG